MVKVAPSFLLANFCSLREEVEKVEQAGVDLIHLDVMDGHFVPNISFGPMVVGVIDRLTDIPLDVHLMIEDPDKYLDVFAAKGADYLTVHVEACDDLSGTIAHIKGLNRRVGVALNPATPLTSIEGVLPELDLTLLMTVNPGFGGQEFIPSILEKIRELKQRILRDGYPAAIAVDGGINSETAPLVVDAGAEILVAGSAIFQAEDMAEAVARIRNCPRQS